MEHIITLFHGSEKVVEVPTFGVGKKRMISDLDFTAPKAKDSQRNGLFLLCGTDFAIDIHWIPNI